MARPPFKLERYFARYEFTTSYLLCCSDCESMSLSELLAFDPGAQDAFAALHLGYTDSRGRAELREHIAALYDKIAPEGVLVHAGAKEAIFNFMQVSLSAGDHVVVHFPCYQSLADVARHLGAVVSEWRGDPDNGWALSLRDLKRLLQPQTRVVVVNFPHNPTGFLPGRQFLEELASLSAAHGLIVFSDEVYRGLEYDAAGRLPAFADLSEQAVSLGVMSKAYGLAGLRIGWVATRNRPLLQAMAAFKDCTTICNSAPAEFLATLALRHGEKILDRNRRIIRANLKRLDSFFAAQPDHFRWRRPMAGPVAFPRLLRGNIEIFCDALREEQGVLLLPGSLYKEHNNAFRIGFGRQGLPEALPRLEAFVAHYED